MESGNSELDHYFALLKLIFFYVDKHILARTILTLLPLFIRIDIILKLIKTDRIPIIRE